MKSPVENSSEEISAVSKPVAERSLALDFSKLPSFANKNVGFFRFKRFDEKTYLITNDIGKYAFLSLEQFQEFIAGNIKEWGLFEELKEKHFIKDFAHQENMTALFSRKNQYLAYGPTLHIIVTTLRCNHKCQYCHAAVAPMAAKNMDMTEDTARKVVDAIFYTSSPHLTIEFQWGESLVNWDVVKFVVEYAEVRAYHLKKVVNFALVTNLSLMDEEKLEYLIAHNISISTSLDGDEETHNFNRTFKEGNSYEKVTYWIKRINEEYEKRWFGNRIWALLTVTKKTLPRWREVIDTYVSLGMNGIFLRPMNPYGFALAEIEKLGYTDEEFIEFYRKSMEYILELNKKGLRFQEQLSGIYLMKILRDTDPNYLDERSPCWACIGQVAYNYDGKIYSCDEGRMFWRMGDESFYMTSVADAGKETYTNMIESPTTKIMVQSSTLDGLPWYNDTVYKPYIGVCPIHSYKTSGNIIPNFSKDHKKKIDFAVLDFLFEKLREDETKEIFEAWINPRGRIPIPTECAVI